MLLQWPLPVPQENSCHWNTWAWFLRAVVEYVAPSVNPNGDSVILDMKRRKFCRTLQQAAFVPQRWGCLRNTLCTPAARRGSGVPWAALWFLQWRLVLAWGGRVGLGWLFSGVSASGDFLGWVLVVWRSPCYCKQMFTPVVMAAGRKVLQRHLGTGGDSALEAGPAPPHWLLACLQEEETMPNSFNFYGIWRTGFGQKDQSSSCWKMVVGSVLVMVTDSIGAR